MIYIPASHSVVFGTILSSAATPKKNPATMIMIDKNSIFNRKLLTPGYTVGKRLDICKKVISLNLIRNCLVMIEPVYLLLNSRIHPATSLYPTETNFKRDPVF